jgi:hypothetical protein
VDSTTQIGADGSDIAVLIDDGSAGFSVGNSADGFVRRVINV